MLHCDTFRHPPTRGGHKMGSGTFARLEALPPPNRQGRHVLHRHKIAHSGAPPQNLEHKSRLLGDTFRHPPTRRGHQMGSGTFARLEVPPPPYKKGRHVLYRQFPDWEKYWHNFHMICILYFQHKHWAEDMRGQLTHQLAKCLLFDSPTAL